MRGSQTGRRREREEGVPGACKLRVRHVGLSPSLLPCCLSLHHPPATVPPKTTGAAVSENYLLLFLKRSLPWPSITHVYLS